MIIERIIKPSSHSVTVDELKIWIRRTNSTAEDNLLDSLLWSAEAYAENYMKRSIMPQTWRMSLDSIQDVINLPRGPLSTKSSAIQNFSYYDSTNGTNAMPSTCYTIDSNIEYPKIHLTYDSEWPDDIRNYPDSINIEYLTGYSARTAVPEAIKTWIKLRCASMWENRESAMIGSGNFLTELPRSYIDGLLDEFVILQVA